MRTLSLRTYYTASLCEGVLHILKALVIAFEHSTATVVARSLRNVVELLQVSHDILDGDGSGKSIRRGLNNVQNAELAPT